MTTNYPAYNQKPLTSDDFINLSEPPRPKDTPNISEFTTPEGTWIYDGNNPGRPRPLQRRRSTNYTDALNLREMGKTNKPVQTTSNNSYEENKHYYTPAYSHGPSHDHDRHHRDHWQDYEVQSSSTIDMGDHVQHQHGRHGNQGEANPSHLFKSNYLEENDRNASLPLNQDSETQRKPELFRRRSSFEYEDFKKDIYDRLKFFEK